MNNINFEKDRIDSVTQIDSTKTLSDEVIKLRNLEEQIAASEDHTKTLKEKPRLLQHQFHRCECEQLHPTRK